jgi:hypothetical protein
MRLRSKTTHSSFSEATDHSFRSALTRNHSEPLRKTIPSIDRVPT